MISAEALKDYGGAIVGLLVTLAIGLEGPLRKRIEKHPIVQKVEEHDQLSHDVIEAVTTAVNAAREKDAIAAKAVIDRMEARELHLTAQNEELIRQASVRDSFHQHEMQRAHSAVATATGDAAEAKFELEKCALRETALQEASLSAAKAHAAENLTLRREMAAMRGRLEDYVRRYGAIGGKFTATDIVGNE